MGYFCHMKQAKVKQVDYFAQKEHIEEEVRKHTSYIASKMPDGNGDINTSVILETQDHVMFCSLFQNAWRELLRIISGYRKCCDFIPDKNVTLEAQIKNNKRLTVTPTSLQVDSGENPSETRTITVTPLSLEVESGDDIPNIQKVTVKPLRLELDANGNPKNAHKITVTPTNISI